MIIYFGELYKSINLVEDYRRAGLILSSHARTQLYLEHSHALVILNFDGAYGYLCTHLRHLAEDLCKDHGVNLLHRLRVVCNDEPSLCERFLRYYLDATDVCGDHHIPYHYSYTIKQTVSGSYHAKPSFWQILKGVFGLK